MSTPNIRSFYHCDAHKNPSTGCRVGHQRCCTQCSGPPFVGESFSDGEAFWGPYCVLGEPGFRAVKVHAHVSVFFVRVSGPRPRCFMSAVENARRPPVTWSLGDHHRQKGLCKTLVRLTGTVNPVRSCSSAGSMGNTLFGTYTRNYLSLAGHFFPFLSSDVYHLH